MAARPDRGRDPGRPPDRGGRNLGRIPLPSRYGTVRSGRARKATGGAKATKGRLRIGDASYGCGGPAFRKHQMFLSGVLWPIEQMPTWLQWLSHILPLTYAIQGLRDIMLNGKSLLDVGFQLMALVGFTVGISIIAATSLRKGAG